MILQFNAFVNTVCSLPIMVGLTVAVILDNTIEVEKSKKDRGMPWWVKFRSFRGDNRIEEFYTFPFNLNRSRRRWWGSVAKFGEKANKKTDLTTLDGPCKAPIELQVEGTVKAPADPGASNEPKWIAFNRIEILKLSSGGLFDGQRTIAYKKEGCKGHDYCGSLPIEESIVKLSNISFKNIQGTSARPKAVKIICSATLPCENVEFVDIEIMHCGPTGPAVSQCLNVKPKVSGKQNPAACPTPIPAKPTSVA
ncbi:hypothetical protein PVK06_005557 [Gossypium arboreum]|uniref:Polygalacturonase-like n=1 Tax=Gossypium arboreum TaxID=29729 RepID=A0ABR0QVC2_GOSAR|nr:hypothetical protein PVK06_005557 [Gossypium arboreum]